MSYYEMISAAGIQEQDEEDIPFCDNCLKSLADSTHKINLSL